MENPASVDNDRVVDQPPTSNKRPNDNPSGLRVQPQRNRRHSGPSIGSSPQHFMFSGWTLNSSVTMDMLPQFPGRYEPKSARARDPSLDSGVNEPGTNSGNQNRRPRTFDQEQAPKAVDSRRVCQFSIERIITENVAILSTKITDSKTCLLLAKLFPAHRDAPTLLSKELAVYTACQDIQGNEIPHLYGVWQIPDPPAFSPIVLLTELITPGTTIAELRTAARELCDPADRALAQDHLQGLQETGTKAMNELHLHGVIHRKESCRSC